jgi:hypothetical protein
MKRCTQQRKANLSLLLICNVGRRPIATARVLCSCQLITVATLVFRGSRWEVVNCTTSIFLHHSTYLKLRYNDGFFLGLVGYSQRSDLQVVNDYGNCLNS